jgi:hypothetical protein
MNEAVPLKTLKIPPLHLPEHRDAFYRRRGRRGQGGIRGLAQHAAT